MGFTPMGLNMYASLTTAITVKAEQKEISKAVRPFATESHKKNRNASKISLPAYL